MAIVQLPTTSLQVTPERQELPDSAIVPKSNNVSIDNLPNMLALSVRTKLAKQARKRVATKKIVTITSGVACTEPCAFNRCLKTCRHEMDVPHEEHFCTDHKHKPKIMTQQVASPDVFSNFPSSAPAQNLIQNYTKRFAASLASKPDRTVIIPTKNKSDEAVPGGMPDLVDSSGESAAEDPAASESERESSDEEFQAIDKMDFDYNEESTVPIWDTNLVTPKPELRNFIKASVESVWSIMSEENLNHGPAKCYPAVQLAQDHLKPDPAQVWWIDDNPHGNQNYKVKPAVTPVDKFYEAWQKFDSPGYSGLNMLFPTHLTQDELRTAKKEHVRLREQFYTMLPEPYNNLPVITPENVEDFIAHIESELDEVPPCFMWSWFSGGSNLSRHAKDVCKKQIVLFPIDLRYGWDLRMPKHQKLLQRVDAYFKPFVTTMEPRCKYWSQAGQSRRQEVTDQERASEEGMLTFLVKHFLYLSSDHRHAQIENPQGSDIWRKSPLKVLRSDVCQEFDTAQCCFSDAKDGHRYRKMTKIKATFSCSQTSKSCTCTKGHKKLEGKKTADAAAFADKFCLSMISDMKDAYRVQFNFPSSDPAENDTLPVRTTDDLAKEAADAAKALIFTKHLPCPHCPKWYSSTSTLRTHMLANHGELVRTCLLGFSAAATATATLYPGCQTERALRQAGHTHEQEGKV